jgi:hypothetical protein
MGNPKLYMLGDTPTTAEIRALGLPEQPVNRSKRFARAITIGEFREPRAGEWFLSGARAQAWRTSGGLTTRYHICKLVPVKRETVEMIIELED